MAVTTIENRATALEKIAPKEEGLMTSLFSMLNMVRRKRYLRMCGCMALYMRVCVCVCGCMVLYMRVCMCARVCM